MRGGIVVAGNIVRDCSKLLEHFPEENSLVRCKEMHAAPGGGAANVSMSLAALCPQMPVRPLCLLGQDNEGDALLQALSAYPNIDTGLVGRRGQTAFADVLTVQGSSVRSFVYYPGPNALMDIDDFHPDTLECEILHVGYILALDALDAPDAQFGTRMARLLHMLRQKGIRTSVDVVSEASDRYKTKVPPCLAHADYVFMNEVEAGRTTGLELRNANGQIDLQAVREALSLIRQMGAPGWVAIHMPEGAAGTDVEGHVEFVPGAVLPEGFIAATVGAGDAFAAGTLIAAQRGLGLKDALECGIAAATACLQSPGAAAQCTLEEAVALLNCLPRGAFGQ